MSKKIILLISVFIAIFLSPQGLFADEELKTIRLKTDFNLWKVNLNRVDWVNEYSKSSWNGFEVELPEYLDDTTIQQTSGYLNDASVKGIDFTEVKKYLEKIVEPEIHREKQDVKISLDKDGKVLFDGFAISGQEIDYEKAFYLIKKAFSDKQEDVRVPIKVIEPTVTVESEELKSKGIKSLLATGETDFTGSPRNRRNNISIGLGSFSGQLIAPGEESTAGKIIGRVDATTGYLPELVIKGDKTIPEYGGGLCQVSTTVYRSLLFAGLPITERKNHSYAVSYYDPQGLDATIYPPSPDLKFVNDTEGHILLQTLTVGNKAYANVYGTPAERHVDLIGPWYYDYVGAPPAKVEYTNKLKPGEKQIVGGSHGGFKASWYRRISYTDETKPDVLEHIYSNYEARPLYTLIGQGTAGGTKPSGGEPSANGT